MRRTTFPEFTLDLLGISSLPLSNLLILKPTMQITRFLLNLAYLQAVWAIPAPDHSLQKLLQVPAGHSAALFGQQPIGKNPPFSPGHRDPYDHKVDSVGDDRHPLPFRNGDGTTVMGPRNRDRERQNPDLVRPPSTDHGNMPNMRWSFADSHIRIEVWSF